MNNLYLLHISKLLNIKIFEKTVRDDIFQLICNEITQLTDKIEYLDFSNDCMKFELDNLIGYLKATGISIDEIKRISLCPSVL